MPFEKIMHGLPVRAWCLDKNADCLDWIKIAEVFGFDSCPLVPDERAPFGFAAKEKGTYLLLMLPNVCLLAPVLQVVEEGEGVGQLIVHVRLVLQGNKYWVRGVKVLTNLVIIVFISAVERDRL